MTDIVLLDVNVLVAIAWPNHVHHAVAREWFTDRRPAQWATCPITESGFVRVSSNARAVPAAVSPAEAIELLSKLRQQPGHEFWTDTTSLPESKYVPRERLISHAQVTDAHLLALVRHEGAKLATFARGLTALAHPYAERDVVLLQGVPQQRTDAG